MSGKTFEDYGESLRSYQAYSSPDAHERERAYTERTERVTASKSSIGEKSHHERVERVKDDLYDSKLVKTTISKPGDDVNRVHIVLIDNSGSNRIIANHLRTSSGYLMSVLNTIDPTSQIAFMYCSDHTDGDNFMQNIDYLSPNKDGDKALYSTLKHVSDASGGDEAEAWECALMEACSIKFGKATKKHLYLVTDVVGHGMGMSNDDGCPKQIKWKDAVEKVYGTYDTFEVVGCGDDSSIFELQKQFVKPERVAFDLINLSNIPESRHRAGITGNALLFLIARKTSQQGLEMFLSFLYEKWLDDPVFGAGTEGRAKTMIKHLASYLEPIALPSGVKASGRKIMWDAPALTRSVVDKMLEKILV